MGLSAALLGTSRLALGQPLPSASGPSQSTTSTQSSPTPPVAPKPPAKVDVQPVAHDSEIEERLLRILTATGWFEGPTVTVRDGVVFLTGVTATEDFREWAEDLARNTQDVAAVVNRIEIRQSNIWNFKPARKELRSLWTRVVASLPYVVFGAFILVIAWWASKAASRAAHRAASHRIRAPLLRTVFGQAVGMVVFMIGLYCVLRICGLTRLAVTIIGGTGLLGLVIGIAFRDITENFLASIFLSVQRPFQSGDLVNIAGETGYVQSLTTRTTVIMTLDGNHVQIPNSTVYKSTIRNYSSNPNRRESFTIGIGYKEDVAAAQAVALDVLKKHPAVLKEPEPWVLLDSLASSAVVLQVYFWLDGRDHSWLAVRSSIIRAIKQAFEEKGITMPFEARSTLPPRIVAEVRGADGKGRSNAGEKSRPALVTKAEGGLESEAATIQQQAEHCSTEEMGQDLLAAHS